MPQLSYDLGVHDLSPAGDTVPGGQPLSPTAAGAPVRLAELLLAGFIDAANYDKFEKALERAAALDTRGLLIDFTRVQYINSTGISALIKFFEQFRQRDGLLCLAAVSKPVGLSMHLLGVTSLIPFSKDRTAGRRYLREYFERFDSGEITLPTDDDTAVGAVGGGPTSFEEVVARRGREKSAEGTESTGRVLVVSPVSSRFTSVLGRRFERQSAIYFLVNDRQEAQRRLSEIQPDLIVVDSRSDPDGEFVSRIKVQRESSLTSVIKIYQKSTDVEGEVDFKIWENDYLVDPFEVLNFFTLAEAELLRVPRDRKVFHQQVHFEFRTRADNVERAYKLSDLIIRNVLSDEEEATALYAAVKEGIDNAVRHGNRALPEKRVDINFLVDHSKVTVLVEDQGSGFDYEFYLSRLHREDAFDEAKRRIVENNMRGGLGILLMSRCTDRIQYSGPGNLLRLEKNLH